jgi:tetratricopeptide (TPR) repeat protein
MGDPTRLGWAELGMAGVLRSLRQLDRAIAYGERALNAAKMLDDRGLRINASYGLGLTHLEAGHSDPAIELFGVVTTLIAADTSTDDGARRPYAHLRPAALAQLGPALAEVGRFPEALAHAEEALRLAADTRPHDVLRALHCLGLVHYLRGDTAAAQPLFERALALAQVTENQGWLAAAYAGLGRTLARSGRGEAAIGLLEHAIAMDHAGTGVAPAHRIRQLGGAYLAAGRADEALERGRVALQELAHRGEQHGGGAARTLVLVGAALAARQPPDLAGAEAHYRQALELATPLGLAPLVACCHLGLGQVSRRRGEARLAREHLDIALAAFNRMGMIPWAREAEREREVPTGG